MRPAQQLHPGPANPGPAPRPRTVKTVIDLITGDPGRAWTVSDLARAAGISVRALEGGFQRYVGDSLTSAGSPRPTGTRSAPTPGM